MTLSAGEAMTLPLTATRPAAIQASASRRDASPARAITLAMRSPGFVRCRRSCRAMVCTRRSGGLIAESAGRNER